MLDSSPLIPVPAPVRLAHPLEILAGAEGFEPPSSVLETDSLTVELTPLKFILLSGDAAREILRFAQDDASGLISLPYAACASGNGRRISSAPAAPSSSS